MLQYEKYKKATDFNVMINAPKVSAMQVHTDLIHLHFSAEGNGKGLLLVLDLEWVQGKKMTKTSTRCLRKKNSSSTVKTFITKTKQPNFQQHQCPSFLPCVGITAF